MNSLAQCNRQKYNCMPYTYNTLNIIHVSRHLSTVFLRYRMAVSCKGIEYKNIQLRRIVRSGCFQWSRRESEPAGSTPPHLGKNGVDGSRTRVQKPIPCTSTIIVCCLAVKLSERVYRISHHRLANRLTHRIGSFMIRPRGQSLPRVVSHIVDARAPECGCPGPDKPPEATSLTAY